MGDNSIRHEFEELLDEKTNEFLNVIRKSNQISWCRKNKNYHSIFKMFEPANSDFFEYQHHEQILEWYICDLLINDLLFGAIELGERVAISKKETFPDFENSRISGLDANYDIVSFEEKNITEFILQYRTENEKEDEEDKTFRIGYRYCPPESCRESYIRSLLEEKNLDQIVIVDFSDQIANESKKNIPNQFTFAKEKINFITIRRLFVMFIEEDLYKTYISKVRKTIQEANNIIGFQAVPELSLSNISAFKMEFLDTIALFDFQNATFKLQDGKILRNVQINTQDYKIIEKQFISDGLFRSLVGREGFAINFFTSEYLFKIFKYSKNGNDKNFDFTAIVCGYLKSTEQLLYKIMQFFLQYGSNSGVFIKSNKNEHQLPASIPECDRPHPRYKAQHIAFKPEYEDLFDIAIGSLVNLLHDHPNAWNISKNGSDKIYKILKKYKDDCRNDIFHKHNLDSFDDVDRIRNNSFLCLFYLLGGIKFPGETETYRSALGIYEDTYDRLYRKITNLPEPLQKYFIINSGGRDIKVVYDRTQQTDQYDECGHILSTLRFIKVPDFDIVDNYFDFINHKYDEDEIIVTRDNYPTDIKYMRQDGQFQSLKN